MSVLRESRQLMQTDLEPNPYLPSPSSLPIRGWPVSILQRVFLTIGGIWLLGYGMLMLLAISHNGRSYLVNAWYTNFHAAMLAKDTITCIVATLGGTLLLFRHRAGWYLALFFLFWYFVWNVLLLAMAETFHWMFPVRHAEVASVMMRGTVTAGIGLVLLAWIPPAKPSSDRLLQPSRGVGLIFVLAFVSVLAINVWSGTR